MGLYLLNISVDTPDLQPDSIPENLSINDQESIVEILVEKVLGFENAFKEYDDHDMENQNKKKNVKIDLLDQFFHVTNTDKNQDFIGRKLFLEYQARLMQGFGEIDSPPPQV